jgi:hypothetical protein
MDQFLEQLASGTVNACDDESIFTKSFDKEMLETWCRIRVKDKGFSTIRGLDGRIVNGVLEKVSDHRGSSKKLCTWLEAAWIEDETTVKSNEFFHESAVSHLVRTHLSDVPVFSRATLQNGGWQGKAKNALLQFQKVAGDELERVVNDLTFEEMRSAMLQVLAGICIAQDRIKLKHHDLHLLNVLATPLDGDSEVWQAKLPFGTVNIPVTGVRANIIDFGLSAATDPATGKRYVRLDEELLMKRPSSLDSTMTDDDDWGVWGPSLDDDTGYDFVMFVESFVEELACDRPLNIQKLALVASLQSLVDVDVTSRARPVEKTMVDWKAVFATLGVHPEGGETETTPEIK